MKITPGDAFHQLLALLRRLDEAKIAHSLCQVRDDAIMIRADVPGERWEIEFVEYDDEVQVEIERFRSNGSIEDETFFDILFAQFSADSPEQTPEEIREYHESFFRR